MNVDNQSIDAVPESGSIARLPASTLRQYAKEKYGIDLQETSNPDLPFMGEHGCTVPEAKIQDKEITY